MTSVKNSSGQNVVTPTLLANIQPLRYRGYVYDNETGLYYLRSRYYDPVTHRFINADDNDIPLVSDSNLYNKNLFSYCDNNPIIRKDDNGDFWHLVVGAVVGAVIGTAAALLSGGDLGDAIIGGLAGAASGALTASGIGLVGQIVGGAAIAAGNNIATQAKDNIIGKQEGFSVGSLLLDTTVGAVCGLISGTGASSVASKAGGQKQMWNYGADTIKRTFNELRQNGFKAYVKEAGKAAKYYLKNTVQNTKNLFARRVRIAAAVNSGYTIAKGRYTM